MAKDWNGNAGSIFKTLGASNHTENPQQGGDGGQGDGGIE